MQIKTGSRMPRRTVVAAAAVALAASTLSILAIPAHAATGSLAGTWSGSEQGKRNVSSVILSASGDSYTAAVKIWCGGKTQTKECTENGTGNVTVQYNTANQPTSGTKTITIDYPDLQKTIVLTPKGANEMTYFRSARRQDWTYNKTSGTLTRTS